MTFFLTSLKIPHLSLVIHFDRSIHFHRKTSFFNDLISAVVLQNTFGYSSNVVFDFRMRHICRVSIKMTFKYYRTRRTVHYVLEQYNISVWNQNIKTSYTYDAYITIYCDTCAVVRAVQSAFKDTIVILLLS